MMDLAVVLIAALPVSSPATLGNEVAFRRGRYPSDSRVTVSSLSASS